MYYISTDKQKLEDYNEWVTISESYDDTTNSWSNIIEHKDGNLFAIKAHYKYDPELESREDISDFYETEELQ